MTTNTREAPDRIWAQVTIRDSQRGTWAIGPINNVANVNYVRSDLFDAMQARAEKAEAGNERLREALDNIEALNLTAEDENSHQWENSDLIGQEIRHARTGRAALEQKEEGTCNTCTQLLNEALNLTIRGRTLDGIQRRADNLEASGDPEGWQKDGAFDSYVEKHNAECEPWKHIETRSLTPQLWAEDQFQKALYGWECPITQAPHG